MRILSTTFLLLSFLPTVVTQQIPRDEIPSIHLAYDGYEEPAYFQEYEDHLGSDLLKRCVKREFPPESGSSCRKDPKVCLWGQQVCNSKDAANGDAGDLHPATRCNCVDRVWTCQEFQCPTIGATCPAQDPSTTVSPPVCKTDLTCDYEEQACCGQTFPKKT